MAEEGALLIGALLRRRGAGGGCHRNAPFVFIVDKIGSAHFPIHAPTHSHAGRTSLWSHLPTSNTNNAGNNWPNMYQPTPTAPNRTDTDPRYERPPPTKGQRTDPTHRSSQILTYLPYQKLYLQSRNSTIILFLMYRLAYLINFINYYSPSSHNFKIIQSHSVRV